jgi:hypothetical protein
MTQILVALVLLLVVLYFTMGGIRKIISWPAVIALVLVATRLGWTLNAFTHH